MGSKNTDRSWGCSAYTDGMDYSLTVSFLVSE